jgi:hypothetical protein
MAVIPRVFGTVGFKYTPNGDQQIEASSRRRRRALSFMLCDRAKWNLWWATNDDDEQYCFAVAL